MLSKYLRIKISKETDRVKKAKVKKSSEILIFFDEAWTTFLLVTETYISSTKLVCASVEITGIYKYLLQCTGGEGNPLNPGKMRLKFLVHIQKLYCHRVCY